MPGTGALPAYNSSGTLLSSTTIGATQNVVVPAHSAGDLLLLVVMGRSASSNFSLDTINTGGWTQLGGAGNEYGGAQATRIAVGWKLGDGSEANVNITTTGTSTTSRLLARVHRFTAANGFASTAVANVGTATTGSGTSLGMPTTNPGGNANRLAVACIAAGAATAGTIAAATGESGGNWTEPVAESSATNGQLGIQVSDQSGGGSISGGTATLSVTGVWVGIGFTLEPATIVPAITSIDSDNDTTDTRTGVVIVGTNLDTSETGSAKIEVSNNATYAAGTIVEIDATAWSNTSLTATLRRESDAAALSTLFTLPLSPAYLWVTDSVGGHNVTGFQFTLRAPGPTPVAALNTNAALNVDTTYLLRVRVENAGDTGATTFRWSYNHNSAGYLPLTTTSTGVKAVAAASFADGDDVPEVLGPGGAYASNNDAASEDGTVTLPAGFPSSGSCEFVQAFRLDSADVSNAQTGLIRLELGDGTDLDTYTNTFQYTVVEVTPASLIFQPLSPAMRTMLVH